MSEQFDDGGPAFPVPATAYHHRVDGIPVVLWLVGKIANGMLSEGRYAPDVLAELSLNHAEAIIAEYRKRDGE